MKEMRKFPEEARCDIEWSLAFAVIMSVHIVSYIY